MLIVYALHQLTVVRAVCTHSFPVRISGLLWKRTVPIYLAISITIQSRFPVGLFYYLRHKKRGSVFLPYLRFLLLKFKKLYEFRGKNQII